MAKQLRLSDLKLDNLSGLDTVTDNDIAVIGVSVRTAFADNAGEFWKNLTKGKDCIHEIPDSRQEDVDNYLPHAFKIKIDENLKKNKKRFLNAGYLKEIDKFDCRFFKLSPKEAALMDPCQRIFLETAYEVMEDAGYAGKNASTYETGVYVGFSDDAKMNYFQMVTLIEPESIPVAIAGNLSSIVPSRISYFMDLKGPALLVDTACSSSLAAIHLACRAIISGDCEQAIAGGVRVNLVPIAHKTTIGIESSDGKTKTFSDDSDGTGVGEGSAAVLLKPLRQALRDGDFIYAVVKGSAVNQDGQSLGITAPSVEAQARVLVKAWKDAGIDPETISYIETHGTGTRIGDPIEAEAIKKAFEQFTNRKQFCAVGSVKTNIGHLFEGAGIFGFVKAVLALKNRQLPPTLHFRRPNRNIPFEDSPIYVNDQLRKWKTKGFPLRCGVTAFGFSGTNCHIVLEEFSKQRFLEVQEPFPSKKVLGRRRQHAVRAHHLLVLSAKSKKSLLQLLKRYKKFLTSNRHVDPADVCFTAGTGRLHFAHRAAVIAGDIAGLREGLERLVRSKLDMGRVQGDHIFYGEHRAGRDNGEFDGPGNGRIDAFVRSGGNDLSILKEIVHYYVLGADLDWGAFYRDMETRRVPLPLYAFDRERCWLDIPPYEETTEKPLAGKLFFDMEWIEDDLPAGEEETGLSGLTLIFDDERGLGRQTASVLRERGRDIVEVVYGDTFEKLGDDADRYRVDGSEENYETLLLQLGDRKIRTVIFMAAMCKEETVDTLEQLHRGQRRGVYNMFHFTRMLLKHYPTEKVEYITIADFVYSVTGKEKRIKPENAPIFGLTHAIDRECETITARCIDIDDTVSPDRIAAELISPKQYRAAAFRDKQRYTERFIPIEIERFDDEKIHIKDRGVYVVTGGSGGIGLEIGKYLARKQKGVNIALVNRKPMPDPRLWDDILDEGEDKKTCAKIEGIREIERIGGHVCLFSADVSDLTQMKQVLEELRRTYGSINGIIHGAGVEGEGLLARKEEEKFTNVFNPKVAGTWVLDYLTRDDPLDFLVLFSTVATFLMNPGQTDYTAANAYLDSYAEYRDRQGKKTLVVNWVTWKETGMAVNYNVNFDIIFKAIPTAQAIEAFDTALNKKMHRVLIGELNLESKLINLLKNAQFRLAGPIRNIIDTSDTPLKSHSGDEQGKGKKVRKVKLTGRSDGKYTKSELLVAKVWGEVLGFEELSIDDNFYELGGDSILATQVVNRLNTGNNLKLSLVEIFNYETIKELAEYVESL
jgi:acyl transferase domain-containing protein/NAD(P)-dependent dehydrogenase (short-subunit alcohol dehydrogenase family)/acyl carrier protein